jgi:hypothetical protein
MEAYTHDVWHVLYQVVLDTDILLSNTFSLGLIQNASRIVDIHRDISTHQAWRNGPCRVFFRCGYIDTHMSKISAHYLFCPSASRILCRFSHFVFYFSVY